MYPQVLSGAGIKRRLGVSNNTASLLKRRLQLFLSDLMPLIKRVMAEDIGAAFEKDLPDDPEEDMTPHVAGKPVVNMDTVALFSASQRANGGRKRHKHTGQTASIYLTDAVAKEKGKYQMYARTHDCDKTGGGRPRLRAGPDTAVALPSYGLSARPGSRLYR